MTNGGAPCRYSLDQILVAIAQLQEQLNDDPDISAQQRTALEALLAFYFALSKQLNAQIDSLASGEAQEPGKHTESLMAGE
jgi:hypothetical protein